MAQNPMGMTGKNFGEEQPDLKFKFNIGMEELRDIVQYLNRKPFEQNFTLLSFDELGPTESLELVNSIFAKLDKKNDVKLKDEGAEKTLDRFVEFLRILDYPGRFDDDTVKRFMLGDKKVLHPIIYYCLVNFEPLIKRAYINKFLLPIAVPDEYTVDDEVKRSYTDYQSLISEFRENHKVYEEKSKSANLAALKEEIISMEKDKENLASKIKEHQHKFENNADFQDILREITFQRKEQEDEATLIDKLRQQRRLLDRSKEELELALQKQFDAKRTIGEESSPDEMIFALKQEIARTKNKINEMTFELKERRKKIVENEKRLYEPLPSPDQIDAMKTKVSMLRNYVVDMNRKLESNRNQDKEDKLFIPKQQEMTVRKKKETVEADMKKLEQEKEAAEDRLREKQKELDKMKGPGYAKKTEIGKYQEKYNEKRARQVKLDQELNELKAENNSLRETLSHLHNEKVEVDKRVRLYEKKYNVPGLRDKVVGIPTIIEQKEEFDLLKGKTLAEMSALVPELQAKLDSMKTKIQPLVTLHKNLKNEIAQLEPLHKEEKAKFDGVTAEAKGGLDQAREKFSQEKAEVYEMDTKIETLNHQMKVMKVMVDMLNKEAEFQEGKKVLNPNYKSYKSWQQSELSSHDAVKTDLKQRREFLRKNYEKGKDQIGYLQTMEFLLQQKLQSKNFKGAANPNRFIEKRDGGADVLVMQNEY